MKRHPRKVGALCAGVIAIALLAPVATDTAAARVTRFQPTREWNIDAILADGTAPLPVRKSDHRSVGGALDVLVDAGATTSTTTTTTGARHRTCSRVPNGVTYGSFAQSPTGSVRDPQSPLGNVSRLVQFQRFRKDDANATLSFKVTSAPDHRPRQQRHSNRAFRNAR